MDSTPSKKKKGKNKKDKLNEMESPPPFKGAGNPAFNDSLQTDDIIKDSEPSPIR